MIYIQSSGGQIPWYLKIVMNKGLDYVRDMMKFIGIKKFEELLVDGTGTTESEKSEAIQHAISKIDDILSEVWKSEPLLVR